MRETLYNDQSSGVFRKVHAVIQLTNRTMEDFMRRLRSLLEGRQFTLHSPRGTVHEACSLGSLKFETTQDGLRQVWLQVEDSLRQPFTAFFDGVHEAPLVDSPDAHRTFYCFAERALEVRIDWLKTQVLFGDTATIRITLD